VIALRQTIALDPKRPQAYYDLGKALASQGNHQAAIEPLRRAIALSPSDPSAHYQLARTLQKLGQTAEANSEMAIFTELKKNQQHSEGGMATGRITK
jgi:Flp pilus assembly protein TadD